MVESADGAALEEAIVMLEGMGFSRSASTEALLQSSSFEGAVELLTASSPKPAAAEAPMSSLRSGLLSNIKQSGSLPSFHVGEHVEIRRSTGYWVKAIVVEVGPKSIKVEYRIDEVAYHKEMRFDSPNLSKSGSHILPFQVGEHVEAVVQGEWCRVVISDMNDTEAVIKTIGTDVYEVVPVESIAALGTHSPLPVSPEVFVPSAATIEAPAQSLPKIEAHARLGDFVDARDESGKWYPAEVVRVYSTGHIIVHYLHFTRRYDEMIPVYEQKHRLAAFHSKSCTPENPHYRVGAWVKVFVSIYGPEKRWVDGVIDQVDGGQVMVRYGSAVHRKKYWFLVRSDEIQMLGVEADDETEPWINETPYDAGDMLAVRDHGKWVWCDVVDVARKKILVRGEGVRKWIHVEDEAPLIARLPPAEEEVMRQEAEAKFKEEMKAMGYKVHEIDRDGNCLFRAVAYEIFGDVEQHVRVRHDTCEYIKNNKDYFSVFIGDDIDAYIEKSSQLGIWGGEPEIYAITELYNKRVDIFVQGAINNPAIRMHHDMEELPVLRLSFHGKSHYNAVVYQNEVPLGDGTMDTLRLRDQRLKTQQESEEVKDGNFHSIRSHSVSRYSGAD